MSISKWVLPVVAVTLLAGAAALAYATHDTLWAWLPGAEADEEKKPDKSEPAQVMLSEQAQQNLQLRVAAVGLTTFQRTIKVPGNIQERASGCGFVVTAPFAGVVKKITAQKGELILPGAPLFTLQILSEPLMNSQTGLYKAWRDLQITQDEMKRFTELVAKGAAPPVKLIELENQQRRHTAIIDGFNQELRIRGLTEDEINAAAQGKFVTETVLRAPKHLHAEALPGQPANSNGGHRDIAAFEVEELKVMTGEHVQVGQSLGHLADHQVLAIEGHLFGNEVPLVRQAAADGLTVQVDFPADSKHQWLEMTQKLKIHYFANKLNPDNQTLGVYLLIVNENKDFKRDDKNYRIWRFRPGQTVVLRFPVEEFKNALVLPAKAVCHEAAEAYVFVQNGKSFQREPVHVLYEDSETAVLANDGSIVAGDQVVMNAAAALNRVLKAKAQEGGDAPGHSHDH